jgi:ATP-dependent Clp protease, protease subunit
MKDVLAFALTAAKDFPSRVTAKRVSVKKGKIEVYGAIGGGFWSDGITAKDFKKQLKDLGAVDEIDLHINSEGGMVTEARDMYHALQDHPATVNVTIGGLAASAATFLAMAGDSIAISEGALFMIHNASLVTFGGIPEHEGSIRLLKSVNETIIDTYVARTKINRKKVTDWMDAETWFTGKEAVDHGFADTMIPNKGREGEDDEATNFAANRVQLQNKVVACGKPGLAFNKVPVQLRPNHQRAQAILAKLKG